MNLQPETVMGSKVVGMKFDTGPEARSRGCWNLYHWAVTDKNQEFLVRVQTFNTDRKGSGKKWAMEMAEELNRSYSGVQQ